MKTLTIVKHLCKNYSSILRDYQPWGWRWWGDCRCFRQVSVNRLCTDTFTSVQTCLVLALLLTDGLISGSDDHACGSLFLSPSDVWACPWLVARCHVLITLSFLLLSACSILVFLGLRSTQWLCFLPMWCSHRRENARCDVLWENNADCTLQCNCFSHFVIMCQWLFTPNVWLVCRRVSASESSLLSWLVFVECLL